MLENQPITLKLQGRESYTTTIFLCEKGTAIADASIDAWQQQMIKQSGESVLVVRMPKQVRIFGMIEKHNSKEHYKLKEDARKLGYQISLELKKLGTDKVCISSANADENLLLDLAEGLILSNYQFETYKTEKKPSKLGRIAIAAKKIKQESLDELTEVLTGVYFARTFVNEPVITLTAKVFAEEMTKVGRLAKFRVKVLGKKEIIKEGMGGLLGVNAGSQDHPTFTVMEYKPVGAKNKKPIILVGKGVVFDTGGLSLKPTAGSMDSMKSDMAGAATVVGTLYAVAKNKLPIHVIGLVPATDNRPGENAITPGDVLTFRNGKTAEILNTDAEGRLILADALSYASDYNPELVLDFATLTGSQVMTMSTLGAAIMGTASQSDMDRLRMSGNETYERVHELPFWDEYGEMIKSDIADIKNIGGREAGCITAGKFLEHFVDYPWIHVDLAGPSFLMSNEAYRLKGGTGYGVRLMYHFLKSRINKK